MIGIDLTYTKGWRRGSSPQRVPRARRSSRPGWPSRWLGSCTRRSRPPKLPQGSLPARSSARRPKPETNPNQGSRALLVKQTGFGSFLASSKPIFECKYSWCNILQNLQHLRTFADVDFRVFCLCFQRLHNFSSGFPRWFSRLFSSWDSNFCTAPNSTFVEFWWILKYVSFCRSSVNFPD